MPNNGNRNKLTIALALLRVLAPVLTVPVRLMCDSWFIRGRLVLPLRQRGIHVIAQARIDTALFLPLTLESQPERGRRMYGQRLTPEAIDALPAQILSLMLYGKPQSVGVRSTIALARFLKGMTVHAVWCEFYHAGKQTRSKPRLLLATETELSPESVVKLYARRWGIEPLFHTTRLVPLGKRWWTIDNLWQQTRGALETWMQIRCILGLWLTCWP